LTASEPQPPTDRAWQRLDGGGAFAQHSGVFFMTTDRLDPGEQARFGFRVEPHHCNLRPQCHGGMMATFLDLALARGLRLVGGIDPPLPTIAMSMDFMASAPLGSWVDARVSVGRISRSNGFVSALLHADGTPVVRGSGVYRHYRGART
jgi:acyl-coenzyme A thioesterase PaaI-like protein